MSKGTIFPLPLRELWHTHIPSRIPDLPSLNGTIHHSGSDVSEPSDGENHDPIIPIREKPNPDMEKIFAFISAHTNPSQQDEESTYKDLRRSAKHVFIDNVSLVTLLLRELFTETLQKAQYLFSQTEIGTIIEELSQGNFAKHLGSIKKIDPLLARIIEKHMHHLYATEYVVSELSQSDFFKYLDKIFSQLDPALQKFLKENLHQTSVLEEGRQMNTFAPKKLMDIFPSTTPIRAELRLSTRTAIEIVEIAQITALRNFAKAHLVFPNPENLDSATAIATIKLTHQIHVIQENNQPKVISTPSDFKIIAHHETANFIFPTRQFCVLNAPDVLLQHQFMTKLFLENYAMETSSKKTTSPQDTVIDYENLIGKKSKYNDTSKKIWSFVAKEKDLNTLTNQRPDTQTPLKTFLKTPTLLPHVIIRKKAVSAEELLLGTSLNRHILPANAHMKEFSHYMVRAQHLEEDIRQEIKQATAPYQTVALPIVEALQKDIVDLETLIRHFPGSPKNHQRKDEIQQKQNAMIQHLMQRIQSGVQTPTISENLYLRETLIQILRKTLASLRAEKNQLDIPGVEQLSSRLEKKMLAIQSKILQRNNKIKRLSPTQAPRKIVKQIEKIFALHEKNISQLEKKIEKQAKNTTGAVETMLALRLSLVEALKNYTAEIQRRIEIIGKIPGDHREYIATRWKKLDAAQIKIQTISSAHRKTRNRWEAEKLQAFSQQIEAYENQCQELEKAQQLQAEQFERDRKQTLTTYVEAKQRELSALRGKAERSLSLATDAADRAIQFIYTEDGILSAFQSKLANYVAPTIVSHLASPNFKLKATTALTEKLRAHGYTLDNTELQLEFIPQANGSLVVVEMVKFRRVVDNQGQEIKSTGFDPIATIRLSRILEPDPESGITKETALAFQIFAHCQEADILFPAEKPAAEKTSFFRVFLRTFVNFFSGLFSYLFHSTAAKSKSDPGIYTNEHAASDILNKLTPKESSYLRTLTTLNQAPIAPEPLLPAQPTAKERKVPDEIELEAPPPAPYTPPVSLEEKKQQDTSVNVDDIHLSCEIFSPPGMDQRTMTVTTNSLNVSMG